MIVHTSSYEDTRGGWVVSVGEETAYVKVTTNAGKSLTAEYTLKHPVTDGVVHPQDRNILYEKVRAMSHRLYDGTNAE
jgi:hypothetical protein